MFAGPTHTEGWLKGSCCVDQERGTSLTACFQPVPAEDILTSSSENYLRLMVNVHTLAGRREKIIIFAGKF